jgi:hypothetical protein
MNSGNRGLWILLGVLVLIVLLVPLIGGGMMAAGMMGPGMMRGLGPPGSTPNVQVGGWPWAWGLAMGLGMLAMLAFWGAIIVGVVLLVRWLVSTTGHAGTQESALDILTAGALARA